GRSSDRRACDRPESQIPSADVSAARSAVTPVVRTAGQIRSARLHRTLRQATPFGCRWRPGCATGRLSGGYRVPECRAGAGLAGIANHLPLLSLLGSAGAVAAAGAVGPAT